MVPPPDDEHDCGWKAYAKAQSAKLDELSDKLASVTAQLEELAKRRKGHRSKRRRRPKMPRPIPPKSDPAETEKRRRATAELQNTKLETEIIPVPVPPEACRCPTCGSDEKIRNVASASRRPCTSTCRATSDDASFSDRHSPAVAALRLHRDRAGA